MRITFVWEALVVMLLLLPVTALPQVMQLPLLIVQLLLLHGQVLLQAPQLRLQTMVVRLEVGESPIFGLNQTGEGGGRDGVKTQLAGLIFKVGIQKCPKHLVMASLLIILSSQHAFMHA